MSKFVVTCTWDEVPHLSEEDKQDLIASYPAYQADARSKGVPQLGSGAIYPIQEEDVIVDDFPIPKHFPRLYGLDVGWNKTAAMWGAKDRETDVIYLYAEHYRGKAEPSIHASGIKAKGDWIPGVIDPAAKGRSQKDGRRLVDEYREQGLKLNLANNAVEAGLLKVWQMLSSGKLKVFQSCGNWRDEFRLYRRDEQGRIVKENDHLMDATRYLVMTQDHFAQKPVAQEPEKVYVSPSMQSTGWMS